MLKKQIKSYKKLLLRSIREGTTQLWRNKLLSGTTILLGALILFLLNLVFSIGYFADYSLKNLESRADFTVPLRKDYDPFLLDALKNELNKFDLTVTIRTNKKLEDFEIPTRLHLVFGSLQEVKDVFKVLKKIRYDNVIGNWNTEGEKDFVNLIDKLHKIRTNIEKVSFWLSILFLAGGILLVINTFRIVIFSRKEEIFIARFVGADTKFIAGPFLVEGLLLGISASLIGIFAFIFVLREIEVLPGGEIFLYLWNNVFTEEILVSAGVGIVGAWMAIQKYLNGRFEK